MEGNDSQETVNSIRSDSEGLPDNKDSSISWDRDAIASRTLVKTFHIDNEKLIKNIQSHEARRGRHFAQIYEEMLNEHGESLKDSKVLEVGAGPGAVCLAFQELEADVVSLDLKDGRIFYSKDVPFLKASGTGLPFADKSFDMVSLTSVIHHVKKEYREDLLNEAFRVADKVLIQEDCLTSPLTNIAMKVVDDAVSGEIGTHQAESHMTKDGWIKYFEENGIEVQATRDYHPKWMGIGIQKTFFVITKK